MYSTLLSLSSNWFPFSPPPRLQREQERLRKQEELRKEKEVSGQILDFSQLLWWLYFLPLQRKWYVTDLCSLSWSWCIDYNDGLISNWFFFSYFSITVFCVSYIGGSECKGQTLISSYQLISYTGLEETARGGKSSETLWAAPQGSGK